MNSDKTEKTVMIILTLIVVAAFALSVVKLIGFV